MKYAMSRCKCKSKQSEQNLLMPVSNVGTNYENRSQKNKPKNKI